MIKKKPPTAKPQLKKRPSTAKPSSKQTELFLLLTVLSLTFLAYLPALKGGFVNWDDDDYVLSNSLIRSFANLKQMVMQPVQGNYHPLTILSLAVNYALSGEDAFTYHLFNLLLHLANCILVQQFAFRLGKSLIISFATALFFGVHPMHVESVAWVSERKDVLYGFFFMLGMLSYFKYVHQNSTKYYAVTFLFFLLSLASKPAAIIFPLALLPVDFYLKRKLSVKLVLEKVPFLVFSFIMAYLTFTAQKTTGATDASNVFPLFNRVLFVFYGYMMYFFKLFYPINLVAFYPLPPVNERLPLLYYVSPLFFIATLFLCVLTWKKYSAVTFGFSFYFINLLLVLQFFVVGSAILADRYTYIPYIGLFFLLGWLLDKWLKKKTTLAYSLIGGLGFILTLCSYKQAATWQSSETLWDNAIQNLPSERAYVNRATLLRKVGNNALALSYYTKAIKLNKLAFTAYCNRGNIYVDMGNDSLALSDYNHVLELKPDYVQALDNRGGLYSHLKKYDLALTDLNKALQLDAAYKSAYKNRAIVFRDKENFEAAINDFRKYLTFQPQEVEVYNAIGVCYQSEGRFDLSIEPFTQAIQLSNSPVYYLNRSYSWNATGNIEKAREDALTARKLGLKIPNFYAASQDMRP